LALRAGETEEEEGGAEDEAAVEEAVEKSEWEDGGRVEAEGGTWAEGLDSVPSLAAVSEPPAADMPDVRLVQTDGRRRS